MTNKFHSGKLCSAPPTKFFPYADEEPIQKIQEEVAGTFACYIDTFYLAENSFKIIESFQERPKTRVTAVLSALLSEIHQYHMAY